MPARKSRPMFDFKKFADEQLGGLDGMVMRPAAYGVKTPNRETMRKWLQRGSIPPRWFALFLCVHELEYGGAPALSAYLKVRSSK